MSGTTPLVVFLNLHWFIKLACTMGVCSGQEQISVHRQVVSMHPVKFIIKKTETPTPVC